MKHLSYYVIALLVVLGNVLWAQGDEVVFSQKGGFYLTAFPVTLTCQHPNHHIRYTLNGSTPDSGSLLYTDALLLDNTMVSHTDIYRIQISPSDEAFYPDTVMKAIVIRAAVFDESENRVSQVVTQSYFIRSLGCVIHDLPVVSICADSLSLFSADSGILVPGVFFDSDSPRTTGNYIQSGREWERAVNVEYYTTGNESFNQLAGLRTHGGVNNRRAQQKGLKLYARSDYGKKNFKFKIFDELDLDKFKHLVLKPFHSGITPAGVQDWLANRIASNMNMGTLASRPVVLFLNGEYWGVYFLEEKGDERYLESHYDADPDNVNIIAAWGGLENGSSESFFSLYYWLMVADLTDSVQYQYFSDQIDIPNFIDYTIFELYSANVDWPINNVRCWQDGAEPWRWFFYDGDCCFYNQDFDVYANITYTGEEIAYPTAEWSTLFFRKLLENETFVDQFLTRLNEVSCGCLDYSNTKPFLTDIRNRIHDEIDGQVARFKFPVSVQEWSNSCDDIDQFLYDRKRVLGVQTKRFFDLPDTLNSIVCYPNPIKNGKIGIKITWGSNTMEEATICDLMGRCVFKESFFSGEGENEITLFPQLPSGMYVLKIGQQSLKIVIL